MTMKILTQFSNGSKKNRKISLSTGAGAAGGFAGFLTSRVAEFADSTSQVGQAVIQGFWFAAVIASIGTAVALSTFGSDGRRPTVQMVYLGAGTLLGIGFLSGVVAQILFNRLLNPDDLNSCFNNYRRFGNDSELNWCFATAARWPRTAGWLVAGGLGGLGIGAFLNSRRRAKNAVAGGLIAGTIGGALFDAIPAILGTSSLWPSQLFGVILIGALIGLLVSLIENLRLQAWVEVLTGEMKGRSIPLNESINRIGSERSLEIPIIGDRQVAGLHARIVISGPEARFESQGGQIAIDGKTPPCRIVDGDVLHVGGSALRFRNRVDPTEEPKSTDTNQPPKPVQRERPRLELK